MSNADFWSNHLNKSPSKGLKNNNTKVISLFIGFTVINVIDTFVRRFYQPNPDNKEFKVTDVLVYLPSGELALFEALGATKAATFTLVLEYVFFYKSKLNLL